MNSVKYEEYKLYRSAQIEAGKKPLNYIDYISWRFVVMKSQQARIK